MSELLARLFALSPAAFRAAHWQRAPLHAAGDPARLAPLVDDPAAPRAWFAALVAELGVGFAAPPPEAALHRRTARTRVGWRFDHRDLFAVCTAGCERWSLAANAGLPAPLAPHVAGGPRDRWTAPDAVLDPPPQPDTVVDLVAGGALYLPRGTWFAIDCDDDTAVWLFALKLPTWIELVVNTALAELGRSPAWRAVIAGADPAPDPALTAALAALRALRPPR